MRTRQIILAVLFVCAVSFQVTVSWGAIQSIWSDAHHFKPSMLAGWTILLNLQVATPFACLLLGFYVVKARIWDARAWLMLAVPNEAERRRLWP